MRGLFVFLTVLVLSWGRSGTAPAQDAVKGNLNPGHFFHDAPLVGPGVIKGEVAFQQARYFQVPVRKDQEIRAIAQIHKAPYKTAYDSENNQDFTLAIYDQNLGLVGRETLHIRGNPLTPGTFRIKPIQAKTDQMMYVVLAASDNYSSNRPLQAQPLNNKDKKGHIKPSAYTLTIKVEGDFDKSAKPLMPVFRYETKAGNDFASAGPVKLSGLATADLPLGEVLYFRLIVKKGEMLKAATAVRKPWYLAGYGGSDIQTTYTLTIYDDDQVQVAQKKMVIVGNPVEPAPLSVTWPVEISGRAYLSLACQNTGAAPHGFTKIFTPAPSRLALQVAPAENQE